MHVRKAHLLGEPISVFIYYNLIATPKLMKMPKNIRWSSFSWKNRPSFSTRTIRSMSWDRLTTQPSNKTSSMETWTTSSDTSTRLTLMSRTTWRTWSIQSRNGAIGFELDCNTLAEFASSQIWTLTGFQIIAFAVNDFDAYFTFRYSSLTKPLPLAYGKWVTDTYVQESSQGRLWRMIFQWVIQQRLKTLEKK